MKRTVLVSDLSGQTIPEGEAVKIRMSHEDGRRGAVEIDAASHEVTDLMDKGQKVARRGRKPKQD